MLWFLKKIPPDKIFPRRYMDFEQKYQKDPGMNRVNVSHPISPIFWEICFMCGCFGFAHFAAYWFDFCQIVISEDRVTSFSRRVWRRRSPRSEIWLNWLCSGFKLMLLVWCAQVLQMRSREDRLFRLSHLWRHLSCDFCHVPTGM